MYSQNNEEEIILANCPPQAAFLDIGAYDGQTFSNTLALAERGWNGVCLEPDPFNFPRLARLHADNPRIITLKLALGLTTGPIKFYTTHGDGISTANWDHRCKWAKDANHFSEVQADAITFADLRRRIPGYKFYFVNLDVEGNNWPLLQTIDLNEIGCCLLCVEHDGEGKRIKAHLGPQWRLLLKNGENVIYAR